MTSPSDNPRNALDERLRSIGVRTEDHRTVTWAATGHQQFQATVQVTLPTGEQVSATGPPSAGKGPTASAACRALLDQLAASHPHYFADWEQQRLDAQRGDALIKLAAYLAPTPETAAETSRWLQRSEADQWLAALFDRWRAAGDPDLLHWGTHLSTKRKATLVEAIIWRRFGARILAPDADGHLAGIRTLLSQ